ncbi:ABC transporter permease [Clostridium sp. DJ247]|uniref:ABC transporter permease n=1 Tax=Clostridium sp. DJ247 TaxID=2726188 RepID=UPI00162AADEF|nr:ABC transporter permease [Clostridium sp. DJ247]MBC2580176.1 ABC transporter permease [Clostridium sp. DJ247]
MLTALRIAWKFLIKSKFQTLVIVLGIAIGVSVQIFIGLLSKGLEGSLLNKVVGSFVHITVQANKGNIEDWQHKRDKIKSLNPEVNTVAPVVDYHGIIKLNDIKENIQVRGFITEDVNSLYGMQRKIYEGNMITNSGQALVGKNLKDKLGINIGDEITITTFDRKITELTVVGFYDLGAIKLNSVWIITDLQTAQAGAAIGDKVTSMEISVKDAYNADVLGEKIQKSLDSKNFKVENWKDQNELLASGIIGQRICSVVIQFFVLLAAVLSIISILGISVVQKYKQIGILKAMGMGGISSSFIFLLQAFILGVLGTALGIFLTIVYIKGFNRYIVSSDGSPIVNIIINNSFIVKSVLISIVASTTGALFPALKSFRLNPVEVIKNG